MEKREPLYTVGENVSTNWCNHCGKRVWKFLRKLKIELLYDPAIPILGIYLEKMNILIKDMDEGTSLGVQWLRLRTSTAGGSGWIPGWGRSYMRGQKKDMEATQVPTHTHEYYSAIKKNEILPSAAMWTDLENIMLSEINQRKTNTVYLICGM